jgi:hypothetical protein
MSDRRRRRGGNDGSKDAPREVPRALAKSLLSVDFWSTTSPSVGGYSVTPRNLFADCDHSFDRPTTLRLLWPEQYQPMLSEGNCNPDSRRREQFAENWDDLLRLAGSLKLGVVQATSIMRTLQIGDRPTRLAQAVADLGRIDKTIHALTYIDDPWKVSAVSGFLSHSGFRFTMNSSRA